MANMRMVVRGVKRNKLTVLGAVAVEISTGDITSYQILYVTEETKQLILSQTCLRQMGVVSKDFHTKSMKGEVLVLSGEESNLGGVRAGCVCYARSEVPRYQSPCLGHQLRAMLMPWNSGSETILAPLVSTCVNTRHCRP